LDKPGESSSLVFQFCFPGFQFGEFDDFGLVGIDDAFFPALDVGELFFQCGPGGFFDRGVKFLGELCNELFGCEMLGGELDEGFIKNRLRDIHLRA
jgi:hypothetical protein